LRIKIDNTIRPITITSIKTRRDTIHIIPSPEAILPENCVTIPAIIPAKIRRDDPLVIPFSVIISPINTIIIDHTAKTNAVSNTVAQDVVSINPQDKELIKKTIPIDCTKANGKVIYLI
jgi:hypothetical protein